MNIIEHIRLTKDEDGAFFDVHRPSANEGTILIALSDGPIRSTTLAVMTADEAREAGRTLIEAAVILDLLQETD